MRRGAGSDAVLPPADPWGCTTKITVTPVDRLVLAHAAWEWPFAQQRRLEIHAHFDEARRQRTGIWNGRVLMLRDYAVDGRVFRGRFFETDFANLLAWRDWDFPDHAVKNCFAMGALRGSDGGFILGQMSAHTSNAGKIYFPAGTPDPNDVQAGVVDLFGSVLREVEEETGLTIDDFKPEPGWFTVLAGPMIAQMKILQAAEPAADLQRRIDAFIRRQKQPELSAVHVMRSQSDLSGAVPPFMTTFLTHMWTRAPA